MKINLFFKSVIIFSLLFNQIAFAEENMQFLRQDDVQKVMQQILKQHVAQKQITPEIIKKSFANYIEQFDPDRQYLLESEAGLYYNMSDSKAEQILSAYKKGDYSAYIELNRTIEKSIDRSRDIRNKLKLVKKPFFSSSIYPEGNIESQENLPFAKTKAELEARIANGFAVFIQEEEKRFGKNQIAKNQSRVIAIYENHLKSHEDKYLSGQGLSKEQESLFFTHVLKALAASLDSHTKFYDSGEAFDMKVRLDKSFDGVGVILEEASNGLIVKELVAEGPAAKSGLVRPQDLLVAVDGVSMLNKPLSTAASHLRGKNGSVARLTLKRGDQTFNVNLMRETIAVNDGRVETAYERFGNGIIGVIRLPLFYQGDNGISSENDVKEAIKHLQKAGNLRGIVLDLRDNAGGYLNQAVKVAGLFIKSGVVVVSKLDNGEVQYYRDMDGKTAYDGPLVVLTSKETASAAEIVAQALQDYGVAIIAGDEQTYGKGTIQSQNVTDGEGGAALFKVTVGKYYTVSGKTPQLKGVKADVLVPSKLYHDQIGEEYLEGAAPSSAQDKIASSYNDALQDVDPDIKPWYLRYYVPNLQQREDDWRAMIPILKQNSQYRIAKSKNFQMFLTGKSVNQEEDLESSLVLVGQNAKNFGKEDMQVAEGINIVKDMVFLQSQARHQLSIPSFQKVVEQSPNR